MKARLRDAAFLSLASCVVASLVACTSGDSGATNGAQAPAPREHLTLGVATLRISLPLFLAQEQHLFAAHGLDVEVRPYETAQPMIDDVVAGRVDAAGFAAYPIVFLASQGASEPPQIATNLVEDAQHRLSYVLARKDSGLAFPANASGKRIGVLPTVAYRRWLDAILRAAQIDPATVTIVPVAPPMQAQTLAEGGVDMMFTGDPMASAMLASGRAEIIDDGPPCAKRLGDPFDFGTFVLSSALARDRPEAARLLVAAVDDAIERTRRDPAAARRAMGAHLRPAERAFVERYPETAHQASREVADGLLAREIAAETRLGIIERAPRLRAWTPAGAH